MAGNPFYSLFHGGTTAPQLPGVFGQLPKMMQMFRSFQSGFSGNPEQTVRQLMQSGRMTQDQFNALAKAASDFQRMAGL